MSYQIELHREALAELKALPASVRAQATALFDLLATTPRPPRAKDLRDKPGIYRIWLGAGALLTKQAASNCCPADPAQKRY
ncbi:MAG: hypothetical protein J7455_00910 [Roseiflexus sp.]|nr:hypothetical protein [Roseiflexus sp.]MBO9384127.1 hypothetical protein [Roseiflexus sp.]MBO9390764.1 hypothetical protein [Roseiflexus sp.]